MWINKVAILAFTEQISYLRERLEAVEKRATDDRALAHLKLTTLQLENTTLRERFVATEGKMRAAQSRADVITVRLNQLQEERDLMFQKVTGLPVTTPKLTHAPHVYPAGIDFEDIGDEAARQAGHDLLLPTDDLEELGGLPGAVFDPNADSPNPAPPVAPPLDPVTGHTDL